jgi:hypothetical protein
VTPAEREAARALVIAPGGQARVSSDEFLERFGAVDGKALGVDLLRDAVERRDAVDVELALIVCFRFGLSEEHLPLLLNLCYADWHHGHEDVVSALGKIRSPDSIDALVHMAQLVPSYLEYDDSRALATKALWALGAIDGDAADQALSMLARSPDRIVAREAEAQITRRGRPTMPR